ncbi:MAG: type II secretion system protein [Lachnospiraceae bacterium]|nr:type II secretion system protein [Lachnospiraceae bacterium]
MKDDRGFTLVELIVVMAIMGVVITFGVIKSEVLFSYNAQECYKKVMSTLKTEKVQVLAHSTMIGSMDVAKSDGSVSDDVKNYGVYIEFYVDGNSIYTKTYVKGTAKEEKGSKVAGKGVTILYKLTGESTLQTLTESEGRGLMFSYNRATGAFFPYKDGKYVEEIHVLGGSREYKMRLMKKTGKVVRHGR